MLAKLPLVMLRAVVELLVVPEQMAWRIASRTVLDATSHLRPEELVYRAVRDWVLGPDARALRRLSQKAVVSLHVVLFHNDYESCKMLLSSFEGMVRQVRNHQLGRFGWMRLLSWQQQLRLVENRFRQVVSRSAAGSCPPWYCAMSRALTAMYLEVEQLVQIWMPEWVLLQLLNRDRDMQYFRYRYYVAYRRVTRPAQLV